MHRANPTLGVADDAAAFLNERISAKNTTEEELLHDTFTLSRIRTGGMYSGTPR